MFGTVWALMQLFFSPLLGMVSDRFGRRPVVLLSNLGLGLDYILMALAPSLAWLFVGRVISGITSASFSTAMAYLTDITEPEKRAAAFGKVGAAFGAGFILGPAIGGLLGAVDPRLPFWRCGGARSRQLPLWPVRAAGIAAAGSPRAVQLVARQSGRRAAPARLDVDARGAGGRLLPRPDCACRAAQHVCALCELSLRLGYRDGRAVACAGRRLPRWWCRSVSSVRSSNGSASARR